MNTGHIITTENFSYRINAIQNSGAKSSYREVFSAEKLDADSNPVDTVRVVAYHAKGANIAHLKYLAQREEQLYRKLNCEHFDQLIDTYAGEVENGEYIHALIFKTPLNVVSLHRMIKSVNLPKHIVWNLVQELLVALSQINQASGPGVHYNLNLDNVCVYSDSSRTPHILVRSLNCVTSNFSNSQKIDKRLLVSGMRAPELMSGAFVPKSMQFVLAIIIAYLLQGKHPWERVSDKTLAHRNFFIMRDDRPSIDADPSVVSVLAKALSFNPIERYESLDAFVEDLCGAAALVMPQQYVPFGPMPSREEDNAVMGDSNLFSNIVNRHNSELDDEDYRPRSVERDPKVDVDICVKVGKGFDEVAGMGELKDQLKTDFIDIAKNPKLAKAFGLKVPATILFGPPGCGKTYIANKLAEEMGVEFASITPSDFANIYVHGSQMLIRQFFDEAIKRAEKCGGVLVFMDEMEAICPRRSPNANHNQSNEVAELLTILNNLSDKNVWVVAATNCLDCVDPAILRTGRFDKAVYVSLPDAEARKQLFSYALNNVAHESDIDVDRLSILTDGFSSSDITFIIQECARRKFKESVKANGGEPMPITQAIIEEVLSTRRPSVSKSELAGYEAQRIKYATTQEAPKRRSVGFV